MTFQFDFFLIMLLCLFLKQQSRYISIDDFRSDGDKKKKRKAHPETPQFPNEYPIVPLQGKIHDKKPFRMELQAGKNYHWCVCGTSKSQVMY